MHQSAQRRRKRRKREKREKDKNLILTNRDSFPWLADLKRGEGRRKKVSKKYGRGRSESFQIIKQARGTDGGTDDLFVSRSVSAAAAGISVYARIASRLKRIQFRWHTTNRKEARPHKRKKNKRRRKRKRLIFVVSPPPLSSPFHSH